MNITINSLKNDYFQNSTTDQQINNANKSKIQKPFKLKANTNSNETKLVCYLRQKKHFQICNGTK